MGYIGKDLHSVEVLPTDHQEATEVTETSETTTETSSHHN